MNERQEYSNSKDWYISNFDSFEKKLNGESKTYLHQLRKESLKELERQSFPTLKNEEWKYTDVLPIVNENFTPAVNIVQPKLSKNNIEKYLFENFDYNLVVFINGIYSEELSVIKDIPNGVIAGSLNKNYKANSKLIDRHLNKLAKTENAFNALNTAYAYDGFIAVVPDGVVVEKPFQVLFINSSEKENVLAVPRNLIIAGKNSQLSIITNFIGSGSQKYFNNIVTEVYLAENAIVDLYKIQDEKDDSYHIEKVQALQKQNSVFNHYNISFGGAIVRSDINSFLSEENVETHFYGLYLARGTQHVDNHTFADHAKPNCLSNELYKGILDDNSRGVFNGKIMVRKDAQKTNAYQSNKTILLSKTAKIDTKPQLEIYADDVKCSHGATVGQLDEEHEFYIRSRGVPQDIAKSMLIRAFANDVIDKIKIEPLREQLNHKIFEHLHRVEIQNQV